MLIVQDAGSEWKSKAKTVAKELDVDLETIQIGRNGEVYDAEGRWSALSQTQPDGCLLVRPDNIVAWRSQSLGDDATNQLSNALKSSIGW